VNNQDNGAFVVLDRLRRNVTNAKAPIAYYSELMMGFDRFAIDSMPWGPEIWEAIEVMREEIRKAERAEKIIQHGNSSDAFGAADL